MSDNNLSLHKIPKKCQQEKMVPPNLYLQKGNQGSDNFIDKFQNYVIKLKFGDIFMGYMTLE